MPSANISLMELNLVHGVEDRTTAENILHEFWPLDDVDPKKAAFPCCLVWTPLPVVSWLAPFIGHVGICKEDGTVLDFSGSNLINVDDFAFGSVARYLQLDRNQVWFHHFSCLALYSFAFSPLLQHPFPSHYLPFSLFVLSCVCMHVMHLHE